MKDIRLHTNSKTTATCVPNAFIDNYMADANGEFVKIYLYLLRTMSYGDNFSISGMADKFEHTEKDIFRALKYWEKMNILHMEYDSDGDLCGICLSDSAQPDDPAPTPEPTKRTVPSDTSALTPVTGSQTAAKSILISSPMSRFPATCPSTPSAALFPWPRTGPKPASSPSKAAWTSLPSPTP